MNLSCETQLPPERPDTVLRFSFFRDRWVVLSDWSRAPELRIAAIWRQDAGSYTCGAAAAQGVHKLSLPVHVYVQGERGRAAGRVGVGGGFPHPHKLLPSRCAGGDRLLMGAAGPEKRGRVIKEPPPFF